MVHRFKTRVNERSSTNDTADSLKSQHDVSYVSYDFSRLGRLQGRCTAGAKIPTAGIKRVRIQMSSDNLELCRPKTDAAKFQRLCMNTNETCVAHRFAVETK